MKGTDRIVLLSLAIVGLLAAFYFMVLSPKRENAAELERENTELQASIDEQEQVATFAEQARQDFPRYYGRLVVLGKAVPDEADQASTIVQLSQVASRSGVEFRSIKVADSGGTAATAAAATGSATTTPPAGGTSTTSGTTTTPSTETATTPSTETATTPSTGTTTAPSDGSTPPADDSAAGSGTTTPTASTTGAAPATEAAAASLPIGATVGPAGLPVLPYDLAFQGTFFDIAEFMSGVDSLVHLREGSSHVAADGRLVTVDGFSMKPIPTLGGGQKLSASFVVTTYVVPSGQGLTAGATPTGPGTSPLQPSTTPTSTTSPTVSP
jgi:Tfp pilus assembly protein PilO